MAEKLQFSFVKATFEKEGYTLLSTEYIKSSAKLQFKCAYNHRHSISWNSFQQGVRCALCSKRPPIMFDKVKKSFKKEGYILLSTEYINCIDKLNYACPKRHKHSVSWSNWNKKEAPRRCPSCRAEKYTGKNNPSWKGGIVKLGFALYDSYASKLVKFESVHKVARDGLELLGANCLYCNKVFIPKIKAVTHRVNSIHKVSPGEYRFYCSTRCKKACPIFGKHKYQEGHAPITSREVQPALRKLVLERDNWTCQKCGKNKDVQLHCHHFEGLKQNPIESADMDNCITLCKKCHIDVHKQDGCNYNDLKCK